MRLPPRVRAFVDNQPDDGCWLWTGTIRPDGYGVMSLDGRQVRAHRLVYELLVGPIPNGMSLDHRCHTDSSCREAGRCPHRRCVRPDHLEPCPNSENVRRGHGNRLKTHCPHGHPYDETNTRFAANGSRVCKACQSRLHAEWRARQPKKGKANLGRHNAVKTHCKYGHEFTPENTYTPAGTNSRYCRECQRRQGRIKSQRLSEQRRLARGEA